jgi:large subunit ribosomal protein L4
MNVLNKQNNLGSTVARAIALNDVVNESMSWSIPSTKTFAIYIRTLLQNWRQGTVGCKGRSDVSFSNKKPWKQKGTGRARAGSARSPLWRGGGVIFGPQARVRQLKISKEMRRGVLRGLLSRFVENQKVVTLDWIPPTDRPRTAEAYSALKAAEMQEQKVLLFLDINDRVTAASFANIANVHIISFDEPNAYHLSNAAYWLVLKKDFELFKNMVSKWT